MRTYKFALGALLLGAAGACWSKVPVIQLASAAAPTAQSGAARQPLAPAAAPGQRLQSAGSFASYASGAFSVLASAAARTALAENALVAARPQPSSGALLLLVLACLVYLGRRHQQGFALRPDGTLLERLEHAPAHA
jgi:hypothetical protein